MLTHHQKGQVSLLPRCFWRHSAAVRFWKQISPIDMWELRRVRVQLSRPLVLAKESKDSDMARSCGTPSNSSGMSKCSCTGLQRSDKSVTSSLKGLVTNDRSVGLSHLKSSLHWLTSASIQASPSTPLSKCPIRRAEILARLTIQTLQMYRSFDHRDTWTA